MYKFVTNASEFYNLFFISIKPITTFQPSNYYSNDNLGWEQIHSKKFNKEYEKSNMSFRNEAIYYPEFSKIHAISYGMVRSDGNLHVKSLVLDDEKKLLETFSNDLNKAYDHNNKIVLTGHNINGFDIPFIIKRLIINGLPVPIYFKKQLNVKPWEAAILDTMEIWKFNGYNNISLNTLRNLLGIITINLMELDDLNNTYYSGGDHIDDLMINESETQIKIVFELIKKFREALYL